MTDQEIIKLFESSCDEKYDNEVEHYCSNAELMIFARALLSKAIPEGYVVVPNKATNGQVEYTMRLMGMKKKDEEHILSIYRFMLDSAPGANWRAAAPSVEGEGA